MDLIEMARLAESVRQGVDRLVDENAALRTRVRVLEEELIKVQNRLDIYVDVYGGNLD